MIVENDSELSRYLGFSRACISKWRARYPDAPRPLDTEEWRDFIERHDLGLASNRIGKARDSQSFLSEQLAMAAMKLAAVGVRLEAVDQSLGERYNKARRKLLPAWEEMEKAIRDM